MKTVTRALRETVQLLLDLPFGILGFTLVVTGFSLGVGMLITLVGIPILVGTLLAARGLGLADRARANWLLRLDVPRPERRPPATGFFRQLIAPMRDSANWKASAYLLIALPVGVVNFSVAVTIWTTALSALSLPLYAWALPGNGPELWNNTHLDSWWQIAADQRDRPAPHARPSVDRPAVCAARRSAREGAPRPFGEGRADRAAAGDACPIGRRRG